MLKRKCLGSYPIRKEFSRTGESSVKCWSWGRVPILSSYSWLAQALHTGLLTPLIHMLELCSGGQVPRKEMHGGAGGCCISTLHRTWLAEYWNSALKKKLHYQVVCDNLMTCCFQHCLTSALLFPKTVQEDLLPVCLVCSAVMVTKGKTYSYHAYGWLFSPEDRLLWDRKTSFIRTSLNTDIFLILGKLVWEGTSRTYFIIVTAEIS